MNAPAANDARAAIGHNIRRALDLIAAFHAARAGHHDDFVAADFNVADLDDGALRAGSRGWPAYTAKRCGGLP